MLLDLLLELFDLPLSLVDSELDDLEDELADALRLPTTVSNDERAYLLAAGRDPTDQERQLGVEFLEAQPLREFALAMFNLNSFLYVN